jgi:hypothetical protein
MTRQIHTLVSIGGVTSLTLTFFHPAMWAPVGLVLGITALLVAPLVMAEKQVEPPGFFVTLIWIATTALLALAYGFTESFFNVKQVALMIAGLLFGYFLSLARAPAWAAWTPFCLFALYFTAMMVLGREPGDVFSRNSQNYVSVILLALYASAVIMTRPPKVRFVHVLVASFVLVHRLPVRPSAITRAPRHRSVGNRRGHDPCRSVRDFCRSGHPGAAGVPVQIRRPGPA